MGLRRKGVGVALALVVAAGSGSAFAVAAAAQGPGDYQPPSTSTSTTSTTTTLPSNDHQVTLSLDARKQKLRAFIKVKAGCGAEACFVAAEGSLSVKRGKSKRKTFDLEPSAVVPGPNATSTLKLKIPERGKRSAGRALAKGGKAKASIGVGAIDAAGNVATDTRQVELKP